MTAAKRFNTPLCGRMTPSVTGPRRLRHALACAACVFAAALAAAQPVTATTPAQPATTAAPASAPPAPFRQSLPASAFAFEMMPIPASADGSIKPFWIGATELTWEAMDIFVYRLDEEAAPPGVDAVSRPSKPYIPPDRGFGHEGYAAISISFESAQAFCAWLSAHTGRRYRLPTEAEWEHAARCGAPRDAALPAGVTPETLGEFAWTRDNADFTPHPVAKKKPSAWGLHDMLGNVQEWTIAPDATGVCKGGSYKTHAKDLSIGARSVQDAAWNASDPQVPKSRWWLSDAPFVGLRLVCDSPEVITPSKETKP